MDKRSEQEILEKMLAISELIEQGRKDEDEKVGTINYYKNFVFPGSNLAQSDIFVAKIENEKENTNTYEIYSGAANKLIATVNEQGKMYFMPEYIESLRMISPSLVRMLNLENLDFELPKELAKEDRVLTKEERQNILSEEKQSRVLSKDTQKSQEDDEEELKEETRKTPEEEQKENIARRKNISSSSILIVRSNSNLYKDHPNLEPDLYFYRDKDGIVRAEYIDDDGISKPSKYFEPSTTSLRQETVSLGDDGNPITREVPYQVMRTKGLNNADKDIRDIRISINIDTYGYLEISETRQGKNGEWLSHNIEMKGRKYNSQEVNETTSIRTRSAEPDKQTEAFKKVEDTGLEKDRIQYSEMYLIEHADEFIESLIKEGYQKKEAIQILDYMIGEEKLSLEEAKERVNKELAKGEK